MIAATPVTNTGTLEATNGGTLVLDGETVTNTGGTVQVGSGSTVDLESVVISGGTIDMTGTGAINVIGASTINDGTIIENGAITVDAVLTLDNVTVSGTAITNTAGITLDGTVKLEGGASISGGSITNDGTLEVAGPATLSGDALTNTDAVVQVDGGGTLTVGGEEVDGLLVESGVGNGAKKPRGMEVTTVHGKLDHKVPISVDNFSEMPFVQLMLDYDVALVRGMFPWIASKITPGSDGESATQLDRIARENVRQAVLGAYVTGDSLSRHCTVKYSWLRPCMFLDQSVGDEAKAELLEAFPDGVLLARAGKEYAFSRNEKMDEHIVIGHPTAGKGQNRRAMGTALISIQKRINDWVDLLDDFFKRTIPKKWMNAEAFDMDAIKDEPNVPGSIGPFQPQPGLTVESQYIMVEPTPQHQPALPEFIKWFITTLSEEISGALPSLFGNNTGENTVGNSVIQRDQALQRVGCPWNNIQDMFALSAAQAVKCAAECRDGKQITQNLGPERGNVSVNTANLLGGNVLCYPESNPSIPETEEQKAVKIMGMVDKAIAAPGSPFAQWVFSPSNLAETAQALRMKNYKVQGASSVTKQRCEFEKLLRGGPMPNPQVAQMQEGLGKITAEMQQAQLQGVQAPPQAVQMLQQVQQQMKSLPQLISTIPVAQDESENHVVEANECFEWMNSTEGQKFKYGTPQQQAGYENIHLHWTEHVAMAKKIMVQNQPPNKPPSESISVDVSKMPPVVAAQALAKMGIQATPQIFDQQAETALNHKVAGKAIPEALKQPIPEQ